MTTALKLAGTLIILSGLVSCTIKTEIIKEDGSMIVIKSKKDALVEYKEEGKAYKVDNRGKTGIMEDILKMWSLKYLNESEDN